MGVRATGESHGLRCSAFTAFTTFHYLHYLHHLHHPQGCAAEPTPSLCACRPALSRRCCDDDVGAERRRWSLDAADPASQPSPSSEPTHTNPRRRGQAPPLLGAATAVALRYRYGRSYSSSTRERPACHAPMGPPLSPVGLKTPDPCRQSGPCKLQAVFKPRGRRGRTALHPPLVNEIRWNARHWYSLQVQKPEFKNQSPKPRAQSP